MNKRIRELKKLIKENGGEYLVYCPGNPPILEPEEILLEAEGYTRFYGEGENNGEWFTPWEEIDEIDLDIIETNL